MNTRRPHFHRIVACALLLCLTTLAHAKPLYRYRNAEGNVVVDYQVPVELIAGGYEVLNNEGMVIKVVPRALTPEERAIENAENAREEDARAEQERLRKWDESLMLRYSTVDDIEDARRRALGDLQIRMSILKGNRRALKQKVENYQTQAANMERSGMPVDVERLRAIEILQSEISSTERDIKDREREMQELETAYDADIERFEMLRDVVELRQTLRTKK
ncbi:MAG: hypothetical protein KDI33_02660 [Halioglobus sp.]|nr:hypothetical protein [Halioglobus sp.]